MPAQRGAPNRGSQPQKRSAVLRWSDRGAGKFGAWLLDEFGLPAYRYDIDQMSETAARSRLTEVGTNATHLVGNDRVSTIAFNHGYTQFFSSDRRHQWLNKYDGDAGQFAGGFGYLRSEDEVVSTLYLDRPTGAHCERVFGVGYYRREMRTPRYVIREWVYAPFGDDPVLLHDVEITNLSATNRSAAWYEYWAVNPYDQYHKESISTGTPQWDDERRIVSVDQLPGRGDAAPLTIFAAALDTDVDIVETSRRAFFGDGGRGCPDGVAAARKGIAGMVPFDGSVGDTVFVLRSPFDVAAGETVRLRYAYGAAVPDDVTGVVARWSYRSDALVSSERSWCEYLPKVDFGERDDWVGREVAWCAYQLRAATVFDATSGHHVINQGGYWQYVCGGNWGTRSWLHYVLPMIFCDPELARDMIRYTARLQPCGNDNLLPWGVGPLNTRDEHLGPAVDLDAWFLIAAAEYGLATRDIAFFDEMVPFHDVPDGVSVWKHLKIAFRHNESLVGPHSCYRMLSGAGDFDQHDPSLTESVFVVAIVCYAYPRLAELAVLRGDDLFAEQLTTAAARASDVLRWHWTQHGWYSRAWAGDEQIGHGMLYEEVQPWAILAGVPDDEQARRLVENVRRFLTGVGAPPELGGPSLSGSAQVPARRDPEVTETRPPSLTADPSGAGWLGGTYWFDFNGQLTWSLASLADRIPESADFAWDEYVRNSLTNHAERFPEQWNGIISADDCGTAYYAPSDPDGSYKDHSWCGLANERFPQFQWEGQNCEQPTWMVMNALNLAGVTATGRGYRFAPRTSNGFTLEFPEMGLRFEDRLASGWLRTVGDGPLEIEVQIGSKAVGRTLRAFVDGVPTDVTCIDGWVRMSIVSVAQRPLTWSITW